ncbi:MAG: SH3 beta-barrel fold-containing protein, partial [Candidatus Cryptobacteroides sp.]
KAPQKRKPAFNGTFSYFDLVRRDWRCFRIDTLVELDRDYIV